MVTKRSSQPRSDSLMTLGLDIGYGVVKGVTTSQTILFPSVCGYARDIKFRSDEIATRHPGDQITDDEGSWFVGDLALTQLQPGELLRLRGRTANEDAIGNIFRLRMAKVAIGKLLAGKRSGEVIHIRIATGLPVDHMPDSGLLKKTLIGQHLIRTDTTDVVANITEVIVMPQPYGTIYANMLTSDGRPNPYHTATRTGVCDVGTYTVDLAMDDDGEYIDSESGSVEGGVFTAQERIAALLEREYRQKMPYHIVDQVLRTGCFKAHGETVDFTREVIEALEPLRSATLNALGQKWKTGVNVDTIYLSGGGAALVYDVVAGAYRQTKPVKDPQTANARGYLHYSLFLSQNAG